MDDVYETWKAWCSGELGLGEAVDQLVRLGCDYKTADMILSADQKVQREEKKQAMVKDLITVSCQMTRLQHGLK